MKEITNQTNGIVSANFFERWLNEHPKLATCGIVVTFLAPVAKAIWPDIKHGSKYIYDSWIAHLNHKVKIENGLITSTVVDVAEVSETDKSVAA